MKIKKFIAIFTLIFTVYSSSVIAQIITIEPDSPSVDNCIPFGRSTDGPYVGFIYQNIPAFDLGIGDTLAFDLAGDAPNDHPIEYDIELAPTAVNGGSEASGVFTKIISNTQQAAVPYGDGIQGNYELEFAVEAPFNFPGGGLIIRFSNPGVNFTGDSSCEQVLVHGGPGDTSGYFVQRFYTDADGLFPYDSESFDSVGAFRVDANGEPPAPVPVVPVPTMSQWALIMLTMLLGLAVFTNRKRIF